MTSRQNLYAFNYINATAQDNLLIFVAEVTNSRHFQAFKLLNILVSTSNLHIPAH